VRAPLWPRGTEPPPKHAAGGNFADLSMGPKRLKYNSHAEEGVVTEGKIFVFPRLCHVLGDGNGGDPGRFHLAGGSGAKSPVGGGGPRPRGGEGLAGGLGELAGLGRQEDLTSDGRRRARGGGGGEPRRHPIIISSSFPHFLRVCSRFFFFGLLLFWWEGGEDYGGGAGPAGGPLGRPGDGNPFQVSVLGGEVSFFFSAPRTGARQSSFGGDGPRPRSFFGPMFGASGGGKTGERGSVVEHNFFGGKGAANTGNFSRYAGPKTAEKKQVGSGPRGRRRAEGHVPQPKRQSFARAIPLLGGGRANPETWAPRAASSSAAFRVRRWRENLGGKRRGFRSSGKPGIV